MPRMKNLLTPPGSWASASQTPQAPESLLDLSVVIPVYEEALNIGHLLKEVWEVLASQKISAEVIVVDDGSKDDTFSELKRALNLYPFLKVIRLRRNFGQTSALSAGFDQCLGKVVVTMDGDLQNDPRDIPLLLKQLDQGFDIVCGWRRDRKDSFWTRVLPSKIANGIISWMTQVKLHDYGCSLKAFRRDVILNTPLYGEMHRFIPAVASWMGVRLSEMEVNHRARQAGRSKYGLGRTVKVILDLVTVKFLLAYATKPIQIFGAVGLLSLFCGSVMFGWVVFQRFFMAIPANRPLLTLSIMLVLAALQFLCFGILAEMLVRAYHESTHKPIYAIKEVLGGSKAKEEMENRPVGKAAIKG